MQQGNVFTPVCHSYHGGHAWQGDMCGREHMWQGGMCGRGMHGRGCVWQGECMAGGTVWQGACVAKRHAWQGGMCGSRGNAWQGVCMAGACVAGGLHDGGGIHGRRYGHCSRWYASYWNVFLLKFCSCTTWFLDLDNLVRINRAWLYKDLKVSHLQANDNLAQLVRHWTLKPVIDLISYIRSSLTGGNLFCCC